MAKAALNTPFTDGKIKGMSGGGSSPQKVSKKTPSKMKSGKC